jgi:hypothetical protein
MAQRYEHCKLIGTRIEYLGRDGMFEDKKDSTGSEAKAWDFLEKKGWELVTVVASSRGEAIAYFKRPIG